MDRAAFYRGADTGTTGPLDGVRVLDVTTAWAGPMAACVLGDLGADVIHLDLPGSPGGGTDWLPHLPGTELSWAHQTVNRNKRSVTLDLRTATGGGVFLALVAGADIVIENFKPGTLAGWGVGYEDCRRVRPDIVYVSISGYGQFGPWSDRPGYDPAALAASGWMALNGTVDGPPNKAPTFLADDLAGLHGAIGALGALHHRTVTGEGQHVDVALLDSILYQSAGFLTQGAVGLPLDRIGNQVGAQVPCNAYATADGGHVFLAIALDPHWRRLAEAMGRPDLAEAPGFATNAERVANREAVNAVVANWCAGLAREEIAATANRIGVVAAPVNTFAEAAALPQVRERDMLVPTVLSDGSQAPIVGPAAKFSRTPTTVRLAAPRPGQHTDEILEGIGISEELRQRLRSDGVV